MLDGDWPRRTVLVADVLLATIFAGVLLLGVYETLSHTACCFVPVT